MTCAFNKINFSYLFYKSLLVLFVRVVRTGEIIIKEIKASRLKILKPERNAGGTVADYTNITPGFSCNKHNYY